jgi:glyoxylase-like metal-dependent hydrolase (beta-lactamase superfamily II)
MSEMTRRTAIVGTASLGLAAVCGSARGTAPIATEQAPSFYRIKLGDAQVTLLHDGARSFPMPDNFVSNASKADALAAAEGAFMPAGKVTVPFNPTLINTGSKLVLIDTGNGPAPDGAVGRLFANLAAAGVKPGDIDLVLISHLHPDHTNGLLTSDGKIAFPKAEIKASAKDWTFWMSDENMAKANDPVTKNYFANTRKILSGIKDHIGMFDWDQEVAPGITSIGTPGHTPGHTSFVIASGKDKMLVQSDVTNIPSFFLQNPDWHVMYDYDADQAQATRHRFYDMAAAEKMLVAGYHFPFPSAGHVERVGTGYRLVPIAWNAVL